MAIPVGTIIEVTQLTRLCGQTCMNVYHYAVNIASSTPNGVNELTDFLNQHWNAGPGTISEAFLSVIPVSAEVFASYAQAVFPVRARKVVINQAHVGQRDVANQANVQASVTLTADLAGRRYIGGKRVPMTPLDSLDGNLIATYVPVLLLYAVACAEPLAVAIGGGEYVPVIYHRPPAPPPQFSLITDAFVQPTTRVIRRRTVGLGI